MMRWLRFRRNKREREAVEARLEVMLENQQKAADKLDQILDGLKFASDLNDFLKDAK